MAPHPRCQRERAQKICESPVRPPSALVIHRSAPKVPPMAIFPHPERPKFVRLEHSNSHRWRIMAGWEDLKPFKKDRRTRDMKPGISDGRRFRRKYPDERAQSGYYAKTDTPTYAQPAASANQPIYQAPRYDDGYDAEESRPGPSTRPDDDDLARPASLLGERAQRTAPAPERGSDEKIERTSPAATKAEEEAKELLDNGSALYERGLLEEALEKYSEVITRFQEAEEPALRVIVAKAIFNMGNALCKAELLEEERLWEEAIEAYTEVRTRFGEAEEPALREVVAKTKRNLDMLYDLNDYQDGRKGRTEKGNYRRLEIDMTGSYFPYFQSWRYYDEFTAGLLPLFSDDKNLGV
jgi:tetratricopeptide (TPR) repeat protein